MCGVVMAGIGCRTELRVGCGTRLMWLGWEGQLQLGIDDPEMVSRLLT